MPRGRSLYHPLPPTTQRQAIGALEGSEPVTPIEANRVSTEVDSVVSEVETPDKELETPESELETPDRELLKGRHRRRRRIDG